MLSSCFCAPFSRWRKPLMYSSSGSCCCWCISSKARKTSTRCFFSVTRSACSTSRTTGRYRAVFIGLQVFMFVCGLKCSPGGGGKVVWPSVISRHSEHISLGCFGRACSSRSPGCNSTKTLTLSEGNSAGSKIKICCSTLPLARMMRKRARVVRVFSRFMSVLP